MSKFNKFEMKAKVLWKSRFFYTIGNFVNWRAGGKSMELQLYSTVGQRCTVHYWNDYDDLLAAKK